MKKILFCIGFFCLTFAAVSPAQQTYPQIDISGFKKWETKQVGVEPARNYFAGLTHLGGFYPTFTGGPWQERLQLRILGQLSENLSVTYDLEQQPESPEKFDVKVKYYNNELTFGKFNATFSGNEFVSTSKYLDGVMITARDTWYDVVTVPSGKLISQTQALTSQKGNNTRGPYNLGHGSIVEGSEQIQLNNIFLGRNVDYTIDYFEGKITFNRILNNTDEFKYSYEFTNILDLFFPTLAKRDFLGFQSRFVIDPEKFGQPALQEEPVTAAARDTFPGAGTIEPEVQEEEASGRYRLKNIPLVRFSESLTFMGTQLKKNEDYIIRYEDGEIKLLTRFLPSSEEALSVEYRYYKTSAEVEAIAGIGSPGPYRARHKNIVPESERLEVDGKLLIRDLDYKIKYDAGEILFGVVIGQTSQIKVAYSHNVMALPSVIPSKFPKELKLGTTYLRESAKKGTTAATAAAIESFTGQSLIDNNYIINLKNRPILPTSEAALIVRLRRGGVSQQLTWEADFVVPATSIDPATGLVRVSPEVQLAYITDRSDLSDGYATGTIYLNNSSVALTASDEITVAYTYKKSIVGKYSGVGEGKRGTYFLRSTRNIVPGSETVQVWEQGSSAITTYTRNPSFDATAGSAGYSINYNADNPSITFNTELAATKNFQVVFQYVSVVAATKGDIAQVAYGFDGSFKIGEVFKLDSSYAKSETDQVYVAETTVETFAGNGTKNYSLRSPGDIIEGSEKIIVNRQLLNRDIDYFITYAKPGSFNFYYITPATLDAISVEYNFQSLTGVEVGARVKTDTAFRLGAQTRLFDDVLTVGGTTKKIGFDFSPLGGTAIGVGSEYEDYNLSFKPSFHSFFTNYSYKFNKNPIGATRRTFLRSYDHTVSAGISPAGRGKLDFSYRNFATLDDPLSSGALHNSDNLQESFSASLVPGDIQRGLLTFSHKYDLRRTTSKSDVLDQGPARATSNIDYYHTGGNLKFTERIGLGYDFQYNEPVTLGSLETETAHSRVIDNSYNISLDLTTLFLQKWTTRISLLNHDENKFVPTPETTLSTRNETYHMDITPFTLLTGSLDHNRQERLSYVVGQENPRSSRSTVNARLSPLSWFSIGGNYSRSQSIPETGTANESTGRTKGGDVDLTPISHNLVRLSSRFSTSDTTQTAPAGGIKVTTDTNTFSQNYTMNLNLIPLLPLTLGFVAEDYKNSNDSPTSPVTTETQNLTYTGSGTLMLPLLPRLALSGDFNKKITRDLRRNVDSPKTVTNAKASYQVWSWGTLVYDLTQERNEGEIQAGVVAGLNYFKNTSTLSLNIVLPVDNPVLTNFTVQASLKTVAYSNYSNPADDFTARLMSFEGALNF